jgi:ABC-type Fe3+/spermidine/putrescine transport system ATPase subunit
LRCVGLSVDYPGTKAVDGIDLDVAHREMVALLGPSGSGKSTLLHAVAGLVQPSDGEIWLAGRRVADRRRSTPPERRDVGLVFQDFALWPHLTCLETVAYPLRRAGRPRVAARVRAQQLLDQLDIGGLAARRPADLSGGQQQRVGLARALARDPRVFLLDEPTAHLDTHLRASFQDSVRERRASTGAAALYATHDAGEALALADRVALIVAGKLIQIGAPATVYAEPVNAAAAMLTGPGTVVNARVATLSGGQLSVDLGVGTAEVAGGGIDEPQPGLRRLLLRPEWVHPDGPFRSRVTARAFRGPHTDYALGTDAGPVFMRIPGAPRLGTGDEVSWGLRRAWVVPGEPDRDAVPGGSAERGDGARMLDAVVDDVEV